MMMMMIWLAQLRNEHGKSTVLIETLKNSNWEPHHIISCTICRIRKEEHPHQICHFILLNNVSCVVCASPLFDNSRRGHTTTTSPPWPSMVLTFEIHPRRSLCQRTEMLASGISVEVFHTNSYFDLYGSSREVKLLLSILLF